MTTPYVNESIGSDIAVKLAAVCVLLPLLLVLIALIVNLMRRANKQSSQFERAVEQNDRSLALAERTVELLESIDRKLDGDDPSSSTEN